jgi:hypothetical protein
MNKLLLSAALLSFVSFAQAGDDIVPLRTSGSIGVLRDSGNQYRHTLANDWGENMTPAERSRAQIYRPTQHFYMRNHIVSYRYTSTRFTLWNGTNARNYLGPMGALFVPNDRDLPSDVGIRNFATLTRRPQPGVPMVPRGKSSRASTAADGSPTTSIQLVSSK